MEMTSQSTDYTQWGIPAEQTLTETCLYLAQNASEENTQGHLQIGNTRPLKELVQSTSYTIIGYLRQIYQEEEKENRNVCYKRDCHRMLTESEIQKSQQDKTLNKETGNQFVLISAELKGHVNCVLESKNEQEL